MRASVFRYKQPVHTNIPNELIDWQMAGMTGAEIKIMIYLCRRTFGFHREEDSISLRQLMDGLIVRGQQMDQGTGLSKRPVREAIKSLEEKRLIWVERGNDPATGHKTNRYAVLVEGDERGTEGERVGYKVPQGVGYKVPQGVGYKVPPLNKERNKGFRNKAPYIPPEKKETQNPPPCGDGKCEGSGVISGIVTVDGIRSGTTVLCPCEAGQRHARWFQEMSA